MGADVVMRLVSRSRSSRAVKRQAAPAVVVDAAFERGRVETARIAEGRLLVLDRRARRAAAKAVEQSSRKSCTTEGLNGLATPSPCQMRLARCRPQEKRMSKKMHAGSPAATGTTFDAARRPLKS